MNTQNQLTETQKKALEVVKKLSEENKIDLNEAIQLIMAIYENQKEFVYVPYQNPWVEPYRPWTTEPWTTEPYYTTPNTAPWWDMNKIMCDANANTAHVDPDNNSTYTTDSTITEPLKWITDLLMD